MGILRAIIKAVMEIDTRKLKRRSGLLNRRGKDEGEKQIGRIRH